MSDVYKFFTYTMHARALTRTSKFHETPLQPFRKALRRKSLPA